jgi:hypothetical protein
MKAREKAAMLRKRRLSDNGAPRRCQPVVLRNKIPKGRNAGRQTTLHVNVMKATKHVHSHVGPTAAQQS